MVKLEEIIVVEVCRGKGADYDPCRTVVQFWSKKGTLLAENDPLAPTYDPHSAEWISPVWQRIRKMGKDKNKQ
jgi:hypothetical protein